jgi:glycosyltransferase involved in cell wall biosynthesis
MRSVAIILPAYNEELTISDTIEDFHRELPEATIVVVNNASSDNTFAVATRTLKTLGAHGMVINEPRPGKANAVRTGLRTVDADIYVMADADLTYPAKHIHELIKPIQDKSADMVVGDRISGGNYQAENKRQFHNFGNRLICTLVNRLFRARLTDILSGYRAMSRSFARNYPILVSGFQLETDMTLHALDKRFRVAEIPIDYRDRPLGSSSKLHTFRDGARVLITLIDIFRHYRPLLFFGSVTLLLLLAAALASVPVFQDWLAYRYIYHVPLAILASGISLLAMLALSLGLVLDSIAYQNRMNFERDLNTQCHENSGDR